MHFFIQHGGVALYAVGVVVVVVVVGNSYNFATEFGHVYAHHLTVVGVANYRRAHLTDYSETGMSQVL